MRGFYTEKISPCKTPFRISTRIGDMKTATTTATVSSILPVLPPVISHGVSCRSIALSGRFCRINSFIATVIDHEQLTYRYQGRRFRLTDVHGHLVKDILA